ncbi:hypothetical protein [Roseateles sp. L2-2]|uniref:hypothetical protein n=1 Tax=Roseateles sp. L2-2 TaxID=3422597 RepID=UPI003D36F6D3
MSAPLNHSGIGKVVHARVTTPPVSEPVRDPIDRRGDNFRVKYASVKQARAIACESMLESQVAMLLEFARGVVCYSQQPQ